MHKTPLYQKIQSPMSEPITPPPAASTEPTTKDSPTYLAKSLVSKFRKKTSPLTSFLYKHLDDDGMGSVRHSLKVLLVFSAVMTLFQFIVQSLNLLQFGGTIFLN
ncbi:MAG: hypothetical protein IJC80_06855, partial [Clostridia bacterium]|nr:hypothetical protein [Clostridia bacterium]